MNDREEIATYEIWQKRSENEYLRKGFTLKGKDTVFEENLSLNKAKGRWNYVVSGIHEKPIAFKLLSTEKIDLLPKTDRMTFLNDLLIT